MAWKIPDKAKPYIERAWRGAVAAEVGAYVAGNLVFDTTNIGFTLDNVVSIAIGGIVSALGLSAVGNAVSGNGPAFTKQEKVVKTP
jgi:hypothetical protein